MSCFDGLIGIDRQCTDTEPTSGIYLKDVGLTTQEIERIHNGDYENAVDFANDMIESSRKLLMNYLHSGFSNMYNFNTIINSHRAGFIQDNMRTKAGANEYRGIEVELYNYDSFLQLNITEWYSFLDFTGTVNVLVYDVQQNKQIDTFSITSLANEIVSTTINKSYSSERNKLHLAFLYDSNGINSYHTSTTPDYCEGCDGHSRKLVNEYMYIRGAKIGFAESVIESNLDHIAHLSGMSFQYNIACDHDNWLCNYRSQLGLALAYKSASMIFMHGINNDRLNNTTIDRENLEVRQQMAEDLFTQAYRNILTNIKPPVDVKCFQCKEIQKTVVRIP